MNVEQMLLNNGHEGVVYLVNYDYSDAIIGITHDERLVYDFQKMVEWLVVEEEFTEIEALEWIEYNTIRALPYMGEGAPIIMYSLEKDL